MFSTAHSFGPGRQGPALGWGISLLVHALLAAMLLHAVAQRPDDRPPAGRIDFRLVPPRAAVPARAPAPVAAAVPAPARAKAKPAGVARARVTVPRPVPDVAAPPDAPGQPDIPAAASPPATDAPDAAPAFDMAAARGVARAAAREGNAGLVALPKRPPPTLDPQRETRDEQLARDIARSRRKGCQDAYSSMGILAVLPLLKDAVTGTGCKW